MCAHTLANTKAPPRYFPGKPPISYTAMFFLLPLIILKGLVPQQQVSEAVTRWKRRHFRIYLCHLESRDVQNDTRVAAVVLLEGLRGGPVRQEHLLISMLTVALCC